MGDRDLDRDLAPRFPPPDLERERDAIFFRRSSSGERTGDRDLDLRVRRSSSGDRTRDRDRRRSSLSSSDIASGLGLLPSSLIVECDFS
jgi:hypothetical protein